MNFKYFCKYYQYHFMPLGLQGAFFVKKSGRGEKIYMVLKAYENSANRFLNAAFSYAVEMRFFAQARRIKNQGCRFRQP